MNTGLSNAAFLLFWRTGTDEERVFGLAISGTVFIIRHDKWESVTMTWHIFRLQMDERPPEMGGNYDLVNKIRGHPARVDPPFWGMREILKILHPTELSCYAVFHEASYLDPPFEGDEEDIGFKRDKVTGEWRRLHTGSFTICTHQIFFGRLSHKERECRACGT
jgi:hypothetical protein